MKQQNKRSGSKNKEVRAWGIRRKDVDINQLALAYYLLARRRIEERHERDADDPASDASEGRAA